jgi:hypothetical protein
MEAYGSMHGTLAGSSTVVHEAAQRRTSHNHRPCATRGGMTTCDAQCSCAMPSRHDHTKRLFDHTVTDVSDHTGGRVRLPRFTRLKTRYDGS